MSLSLVYREILTVRHTRRSEERVVNLFEFYWFHFFSIQSGSDRTIYEPDIGNSKLTIPSIVLSYFPP